MSNPAVETPPSAPSVNISRFLAILSKWRWIIALVTGAAVATSAFLTWFVLPKTYQATATLDVTQAVPNQNQASGQPTNQGLQGVVQSVSTLPMATLDTYQWQVTSPVVLTGTTNALEHQGVALSPAQLAKMVKATIVSGTGLIAVVVTDPNPKAAATIANTLTKVYLADVQHQNEQKLSQATDYLKQQVTKAQAELQDATTALTKAESAAGMAPAVQARLATDQKEIASLQAQLIQARVELQADKAGLASVQQQISSTPSLLTSPLAAGQNGGSESNPLYASLLAKQMSLVISLAQEQATVSQLAQALSTVERDASSLPTANPTSIAAVQMLQARVQQLQGAYTTLSQGLTQSEVATATGVGNAVVSLAGPATIPQAPIAPNKKLNVAVALVLGLIVSVGLSFLLEALDNTIKTPDDIQRLSGLPTLVTVPHLAQ